MQFAVIVVKRSMWSKCDDVRYFCAFYIVCFLCFVVQFVCIIFFFFYTLFWNVFFMGGVFYSC